METTIEPEMATWDNFSVINGENCSFYGNSSEICDVNYATESISKKSQELPIDMQFNAGHLLSVIAYSVLLIISSVGNISVGFQLIR